MESKLSKRQFVWFVKFVVLPLSVFKLRIAGLSGLRLIFAPVTAIVY
jgi:hypothetical protein